MTVAQTPKTRNDTRPKTSADTEGKKPHRSRRRTPESPGKPRSARRQDYPGRAQPGDQPRSRRLTTTDDTRPNWAIVLDEYMTIMDIALGEVAGCLGITEQAVNDRRNGRWNIEMKELRRCADIFGFPVTLFFLPPPTMILWCVQNHPELFGNTETYLGKQPVLDAVSMDGLAGVIMNAPAA
jgi:hypothetical protein